MQKAYLAVDVFFILSGFVMAHTTSNWQGANLISFWKFFLQKRFARIYPMHIFSLALVLIYFVASKHLTGDWITALLAHVTLTHAWGYTFYPDYNFASWSISTEWAAYLAFPFLLLGTRKIARSVLTTISLIVIALWGLSIFSLYYKQGALDMSSDVGVIRCFGEFFVGLLLFQLNHQLASLKEETLDLTLILSLCAFAVFFIFEVRDFWFLIPATSTIFCLIRRASIGRALLGNRLSHFLGDISYSIYMLHVPVGLTYIRFWTQWFGSDQSDLQGAAALTSAVALILISSTLAYRKIEVPMRNWLAPRTIQQKKESPLKQPA